MKTNRLLFCGVISKFCCATLAIFAAMAQSFAATVTLPPAADTCVRADHPATNYLSEPDLAIRNRGQLDGKNYDTNVLMRFDLSRIPSGSSITKATLIVWETASYTLDQRIGAYRVTEAWDPAQVTYEQRAWGVHGRHREATSPDEMGSKPRSLMESLSAKDHGCLAPGRIMMSPRWSGNGWIARTQITGCYCTPTSSRMGTAETGASLARMKIPPMNPGSISSMRPALARSLAALPPAGRESH